VDGSDRAKDGTAASYPAGHQTGREFHPAGYQMKDNVWPKPTCTGREPEPHTSWRSFREALFFERRSGTYQLVSPR
jgi:hypothetical protein